MTSQEMKKLARTIARHDRQILALSATPQLAYSSIESGNVKSYDVDGNLKMTIGLQDDGGNTISVISGPVPPTPVNYTVTVDHGSLTVHWDGEFENDAVAPTDWARWTAYAQPGEFVVPERSTAIGGTDSASGGEVTAGVLKGQWTVTVLAWSQAGKPSAMGLPVTVDVPGYGDIVLAEIDAAETLIKNAGEILVSETETLDQKLTEAFDAINAIEVGGRKIHFEERPPTVDDAGTLGDTWFVGTVVGGVMSNTTGQFYYGADGWTEMKLSHEVIGSVDVGTLVAGSAVIKQAVIDKLFADVVVAGMSIATEFIGENAILTGAVTAPKITVSEELWAKFAEFVRIRAEMIEADAIDGMVITGPNIRTAASGARVQLDAGGLSVYDSADDWQVRLTPDGSSFKGDLEAESLVANGAAEFKSTDNLLAQGAKLTLAAGVTDPTAPPIVQPYWDGVEFDPPSGFVPAGLAFDGTYYWTATLGELYDGGLGPGRDLRAIRIHGTTGAVSTITVSQDSSWGVVSVWGVTCIGSELFWLCQVHKVSGATLSPYFAAVVVTNLSGVEVRRFDYPALGYGPSNPLKYKPGIGNDGTNVVIAQCDDGGSLRWRTYNKTTGAKLAEVTGEGNTSSDITGIHIGPSDWGGGTFVTVTKASTGLHATFTTAGAYDTNRSWYAEDTSFTGIVFADGKFRALNPSGVIRKYADANTGDNSGDWWCAYRWETDVNSDGTIDYRSKISPPARFTWPRRAQLKATGQPKPAGVEIMAGFLAKKTTKPTRTDFKRNYTGYSTTRSIAYWDWYQNTGDAPADGNTYPTATPSSITSASGTFEVKGDGSGKWGPLTFNADGTMAGVAATGRATITPTAANTPTSATVTFPAGRFSTPPIPSVANDSGGTSSVTGLGVTNVTATSMTIGITRTNTYPTPVWWTAVAG